MSRIDGINQISIYTTIGNILAGPIIGFWVMPMLLLFLITIPLNAYKYPLLLLEKGVSLVNDIAEYVSNIPGATYGEGISQISSSSIFVITVGILWLCIWQEKWRKLGLIFILIGILNILTTPRADIVFDDNATTIAYRDKNNKLSITPFRKNKFLERVWTGSTKRGKFDYPENEIIKCTKDKCIYKDKIELMNGKIIYNNQEVDVHQAGYISLNKSKIITPIKSSKRIWN